MQSPVKFRLQSQIVNNKCWIRWMRETFVEQNAIKRFQIVNEFQRGPNFNEVGPFWGRTDFNEVVAQICESHINPNLYQFSFILGSISLNSFHRVTALLSYNCRFLTTLDLSRTCLGDESVNFIVKAEWHYIDIFAFASNNITSEGIKQLRKCEWKFISLATLNHNPLKNAGAKELIKLDWRGLKYLCLKDVGLTDDGAKILARAQWPKLIQLNLRKNQFTHEAVFHILRVDWKRPILILLNRYYCYKNTKENLSNLKRKTNRDFIYFGTKEWKC